ncbi:MAG: hypothetical protein M0Z80_15745 [Treponema sp.]|nr:hypothetical protein [Treponema sp.]
MKRTVLAALAAFALIGAAGAQSTSPSASPWTILAAPSVAVPLMAGDGSSSLAFTTSWGGSLDAECALPGTLPLSLRLGAGYSIASLSPMDGVSVPGNLSEAVFLGGLGLGRRVSTAVSTQVFLDGGLAYGSLSTGANSAYAAARAGAELRLSFGSGLFAQVEADALYRAGLYGGLGATIGLGYRLPESAAPSAPARIQLLQLQTMTISSVFPVLRSYYDLHPVGTVRIANTGKEAARDVRVGFLIKQYMDAPKDCGEISVIEPGKSVELPLYALFNDSILDVTEPTKVIGEVSVRYDGGGSLDRTGTVLVYDRNALTWDDNRKAAAFVSNKDPWVLDLTGNIMAAVRDARNPGLPRNLQTAVAVHEGLRIYGIGYMLSTTRPFEQAVFDPQVVDTLKFPRQTLTFRAGDCADLSVLYASCLEAAGVPTAFVTVPGHIFIAVDLGIGQEEAMRRGMSPGDLIVRDGRVWLPIETTMRDAGFLDVWKTAAGEWRDASAKGSAAFYPVHEAWKTFPPMGLPADGTTVASPPHDTVRKAFGSDLGTVVDAQLGARLAALGPAPAASPAAAKYLNDRGVLYGSYGRLSDAEREFVKAAAAGSSPAVVNLGNVALLRSDPAAALGYYQKVEARYSGDERFLVNLAKAASALGRTDLVERSLAAVRKLDPRAADQYAALAEAGPTGTRAAEINAAQPSWF